MGSFGSTCSQSWFGTARVLFLLLMLLVELWGTASHAADWTQTGSLRSSRRSHTATLLQNGKVLVTGGKLTGDDGTDIFLNSAEIYDPATGSWELTGSLGIARITHTATLLPNGRVLVTGGRNSQKLKSAEIYDPETGFWMPTEEHLESPRGSHTATLLRSGLVLIVGGSDADGNALASIEIYDPECGANDSNCSIFQTSPLQLQTARSSHTATLLRSGNVLITCGVTAGGDEDDEDGSQFLSSAEIFDPRGGADGMGSIADAGTLAFRRKRPTATLLPSGEVLIAGGVGPAGFDTALKAEHYDPTCAEEDPSCNRWRRVTDLNRPRSSHSAALLPSGKVLVISDGTAEFYDPASETWTNTDPLTIDDRRGSTATLLPSGKVLVTAGGDNITFNRTAELFDPATYDLTDIAPLQFTGRSKHTATLLPSGNVLLAGGQNDGTAIARAEIFDPIANTFGETDALETARKNHRATLLSSGKVLVTGGKGADERLLASAEIFDPSEGRWSPLPDQCAARRNHTATLLPSGKVLVVGGFGTTSSSLSTTEIYDPDCVQTSGCNECWKKSAGLLDSRAHHTATLLPSGKVLISGGRGGSDENFLSTTEIYDPATEEWTLGQVLGDPREFHTATLLPSGKVLVTGGQRGNPLETSEIYDPTTQAWTPAADLNKRRTEHTATLLPTGRVLVTGGGAGASNGGLQAKSEIYDPAVDAWTETTDLDKERRLHTATLLASGRVLVTGGFSGSTPEDHLSAELYDPGYPSERRPRILLPPNTTSLTISHNEDPVSFSGCGLRGDSEASSGGRAHSPVNTPLVQLRSVEGDLVSWIPSDLAPWTPSDPPDPDSDPPDPCFDPTTLTLGEVPPMFTPGWHLLTVFASGIASPSVWVQLECSLQITTQPQPIEGEVGETATFEVETRGVRSFQWQQCQRAAGCADATGNDAWIDIPGAVESAFTTSLINGSESGTKFRVHVDSGCTQQSSQAALLTVEDDQAPSVEVTSPTGGEFWLLSEPGATPNTELITWSMTDNIRICQVQVSLGVSTDGGTTFPKTDVSNLPKPFETSDGCPPPGVTVTSTDFILPEDFSDLGGSGSLYKIFVTVTDLAGNTTEAESPNPFFIVQSNDDSVRTLILWHSARMGSDELVALETKLNELADHPRVQGRVLDLANVDTIGVADDLDDLYAAWDSYDPDDDNPGDAGPSETELANRVLFGPKGIQDYLQNEVFPIFTGLEYLVLVGGDDVIPLARIEDRAQILSEADYPTEPSDDPRPDDPTPDLTPTGTTVGRALAANQYLSDDPLAVRDRVRLDASGSVEIPVEGICGGDVKKDLAFIPDLAVGRLVERPSEIITTIATFISQSGVLDLSNLTSDDPQVLVTGYDFLQDSANRITERWQSRLGAGMAVNADLIDPAQSWTESDLLERMCGTDNGNILRPFSVANLNGHANHYGEGVPGTDPLDIQGLDTSTLVRADACGETPLDLAGAILYSVGCHAGLPVSDRNGDEEGFDHVLDLPQSYLRQGAVSYVANTGFGWGLREGPPGYGERMVVLMTEELTTAGGASITVGEAIRRTKRRYFVEDSFCFDAYDQKSVMQWTHFGLPMYSLQLAAVTTTDQTTTDQTTTDPTTTDPTTTGQTTTDHVDPFDRPARSLDDVPPIESYDGVIVERQNPQKAAPLPPFLTRLDLHFDFSSVYSKFSAEGPIELDDTCPDTSSGCYYALNGLASGQADIPVQPYFVYDSRLSGTSQHGVLWKGGVYNQEQGWKPLRGVLQSNNFDSFDNLGALPSPGRGRPVGTRLVPSDDPDDTDGCQPSDLEINSLVVPTGEVVADASGELTVERLDQQVDLEIFYFNNTTDPGENCDRQGPVLGEAPFHQVNGTLIEWSVPATDPSGVWRVVLVINDGPTDTTGLGAWQPLELTYDTTDQTWRGAYDVGPGAQLSYFVQAIDHRGNVSWHLFTSEPPSSGIPSGLPGPVQVETLGADLRISQLAEPDPVLAGGLLSTTVTVENHGPSDAHDVVVSDHLPTALTLISTSGCSEDPFGIPACSLDTLPANTSRDITLSFEVDAATPAGTLSLQVSVASSTPEGNPGDETSIEETTVATAADLVISQVDSTDPVIAGQAVTYTVTVDNHGPSDALDVVITQSLPPGTSLDGTSGCDEDPTGSPTCSVGSLAAGSSVQVTFALSVDSGATASTQHDVSVTSSTPEANPGDETSSETTMIDTATDLSLQQVDSMDPVRAGDPLSYVVTVENLGPSDAADVVVATTLSAGFDLSNSSGCLEDPTGVPTCSLGTIVAGTSVQVTLEGSVDSAFQGTLSNIVQVASSTLEANPGDESSSESTTVTTAADLSIFMEDSVDPVLAGNQLVYNLTVTNQGPSDALDVTVTDTLTSGMTFIASNGCDEDPAGVPTCSLGTLTAGDSAQYSLTVQVDSDATGDSTGLLTTQAGVTSSTLEANPGDEQATETTLVERAADLFLVKRDSVDPVMAQSFTYTLEVTNHGPSDASAVEITDTLPDGILFETSQDGCENVEGDVTCSVGVLPSGQSSSRGFSVTLEDSFPPWVINTAQVTGSEADPDLDNNVDSERTVLDVTPPRVTHINSDMTTEDGALLPCQTASVEIRKILVSFDEPVSDPPGDDDNDDVTYAGNYLLVAAGSDRSLDTTQCGPPVGDDVALSIDAVTYESVSRTATVELNGGQHLADDLYRLLVCGSTTIVDLVGNSLDGDSNGTGGDDFSLSFRVEVDSAVNLLANGHFDCDLSGWTVSGIEAEDIVYSSDDYEDSSDSGSVQISQLSSGEILGLNQCLEISPQVELQMSGRVRVEMEFGTAISHHRSCTFYAAAGCNLASVLGTASDSVFLTDTEGAWHLQESIFQAPNGAVSARCEFGVRLLSGNSGTSAIFLDALFIGNGGQLFRDGFESGDASVWASQSGQ